MLHHIRLQPPSHTVAACITYGCRHARRAEVALSRTARAAARLHPILVGCDNYIPITGPTPNPDANPIPTRTPNPNPNPNPTAPPTPTPTPTPTLPPTRWTEAEAAYSKFEELGYFEVPFESPSPPPSPPPPSPPPTPPPAPPAVPDVWCMDAWEAGAHDPGD